MELRINGGSFDRRSADLLVKWRTGNRQKLMGIRTPLRRAAVQDGLTVAVLVDNPDSFDRIRRTALTIIDVWIPSVGRRRDVHLLATSSLKRSNNSNFQQLK